MAELKIITMSDIKPEPVDWLWEPYMPFGAITLIQGDGSEGKTTSSLAIAAAVSKGESLPGSYGNTEPAGVIIQNAEDSYSQVVHPRLERFGADCDMIHAIDETEQELSLSDKRIEQTIIEKQAKLFILDPIQAYLGGADIEQRMQDTGISNKSAFLRKMAIDGHIINLELSEISEVGRLLRITANNVNQISKRINSGGGAYRHDVEEVNRQLTEIRIKFGELLTVLSEITDPKPGKRFLRPLKTTDLLQEAE